MGRPISSQTAPTTLTNGEASAAPATSAVRGTNGCTIKVGLVCHSGDDTCYGANSSGLFTSLDNG